MSLVNILQNRSDTGKPILRRFGFAEIFEVVQAKHVLFQYLGNADTKTDRSIWGECCHHNLCTVDMTFKIMLSCRNQYNTIQCKRAVNLIACYLIVFRTMRHYFINYMLSSTVVYCNEMKNIVINL